VTAVFACAALIAFAANSLLCRLALGGQAIDPATFTSIRLASGALLLVPLAGVTSGASAAPLRGYAAWRSPAALLVYAVAFSFSYLSLTAATGALILFGAVQVTMLGAAILSGERPGAAEWAGLATAAGGLAYLVSPGISAPPTQGWALMTLAGIAWACYSLWGRRSTHPIGDTAKNFLRAVPFALVFNLSAIDGLRVTRSGALLAVTSGALASGLGYVAWYSALPRISATRAATIQLSVPVIAASGGVVLLSEPMTTRLVLSALLILGGIGLAIAGRSRTL
jgi:drug/metabolite transporter (DMT)-like permease